MNYQTANQDELFYSHKTKATFRPLSWREGKKGRVTCQLGCCSVIANGIDAGLCLDFNSLTLFRTTESNRQASPAIPTHNRRHSPSERLFSWSFAN